MANKYGATLSISLRGSIDDQNATGFGTVAAVPRFPFPDLTLGDGNGSGNVNKLYVAAISVTASTTTTLNLTDGSLKDVLGNALVLGKLKAFGIYNSGVQQVTLGGTNAMGLSTTPVHAGGVDVRAYPATGLTVTAADTITITNGAGVAVIVEVAIFGSAS